MKNQKASLVNFVNHQHFDCFKYCKHGFRKVADDICTTHNCRHANPDYKLATQDNAKVKDHVQLVHVATLWLSSLDSRFSRSQCIDPQEVATRSSH